MPTGRASKTKTPKNRSTLKVSKNMKLRIEAFRPVVQLVIGKDLDVDACAELILGQGIESLHAALVGSLDAESFFQTLQQLGKSDPATVYGYVIQMLQIGAVVNPDKFEEAKRKFGVQPTPTSPGGTDS